MMQLPWQRRIEHSAWASGDRTREPILMKFGKQHQVWTTMTVAWSNIKIFNIQNGGRPPCGKIFEMPQLAYQWTKWDATWVVAPHHVLDMSATLRLPWQRPLPSNGALNIPQLWASGDRTREPILMKLGTEQQVRTTMTVTWSNIKILKFKMADGRHVLKYSKCHNSPTNWPTVTQPGCHIPSCSRHVRHDAVAMATVVA